MAVGSKRGTVQAVDRAVAASADAVANIKDPERRAKALALTEQIKARSAEIQKTVKRPRVRQRARDRGEELER